MNRPPGVKTGSGHRAALLHRHTLTQEPHRPLKLQQVDTAIVNRQAGLGAQRRRWPGRDRRFQPRQDVVPLGPLGMHRGEQLQVTPEEPDMQCFPGIG